MKHSLLVAAIILCAFSNASAQFTKGSTELALSAGFGSSTESDGGSSGSTTFAVLSVMPSFYLVDGLAVEPEFGFTLIAPPEGESRNAYSIVGNLSYTSFSPGSTVAPFARIGYGVSNGIQIPVLVGPYNLSSRSITVNILNAGAGLKVLAAPHVEVRAELNYKRQSYSDRGEDYSMGNFGLQLGLGLLLWPTPADKTESPR